MVLFGKVMYTLAIVAIVFLSYYVESTNAAYCFSEDTDYPGDDVGGCVRKDNERECQLMCEKDDRCNRFSYVTERYNGPHKDVKKCCFMKGSTEGRTTKLIGLISGPKLCSIEKSVVDFTACNTQNLELVTACKPDKVALRCKFKGISERKICHLNDAQTSYGCKGVPIEAETECCDWHCTEKLGHLGEECWQPCGRKGGNCPAFCGTEAVCCRRGYANDPVECQGGGCDGNHCCTKKVKPGRKINEFTLCNNKRAGVLQTCSDSNKVVIQCYIHGRHRPAICPFDNRRGFYCGEVYSYENIKCCDYYCDVM